MSRHVHVVGAGLAGLAAALDLAQTGARVTLHEAAAAPGGRCRSFRDERLGRVIDNGNHLVLSGNRNVIDHARRLGSRHLLHEMPEAAFPFADLATGARWTVRVPQNPLPPGAGWGEAGRGLRQILLAGPGATVAEAVPGRGPLWRGFWEPMATAVLNAPPEAGSARLLRAALGRTFLRGPRACRPVLAPEGLGAALVEPAVAALRAMGTVLRPRAPCLGLGAEGGRATALAFAEGPVPLGPRDAVVLAVPPVALAALLPDLPLPGPGHAILNAHFRVPAGLAAGAPPILGLLGGSAQWVFARDDVLSVTVSAAEATPAWGLGREAALALLWSEVSRALGIAGEPLASRLLRERAATFDQSPAGAARRPPTRTALGNVVLAGDHVATGLPATIEGAVVSGRAAAAALL